MSPDLEEATAKPVRRPRLFHINKIGPAFWTVASLFSIFFNIILIAALILIVSQFFSLKRTLADQLVAGLYNNFVLMDEARIHASVPVKTEVPAKFDLPLNTETTVRLTKDTYISGARVSLYTGGLAISSAPTDIILPAGTELPIQLNLTVPVDQKIPVELMVDVDIPLNQTDLHTPFVGLQQVIAPYYDLLNGLPGSWQEALCGPQPGALCRNVIP